ncbi:MAG: DUF4445 domain-containing protein [Candidatus Altiarchaeota archaeon]|nr:DUF4445 domain-containing protein [Candidatus Altiarchaeota archaeon]
MEYIVTFQPDGRVVRIGEDRSLLDAAMEAGICLSALCYGKGRCGRCGVRIEEGRVRSLKPKSGDLHLACQTFPASDLIVFVPPESRLGEHQILSESPSLELSELSGFDVGVAVDVGTTTVFAYLVDLSTKKPVAYASEYNRQVTYGGDVLTRLKYAEHIGVESLNRSIIDTVNSVIASLIEGREHVRVKHIVTAGNTIMTYILLDRDPRIVLEDPELSEFRLPRRLDAEKLRLNCSGSLYSMPGIAGFVGGDVVADILVSGLHKSEKPSMLVDVGTNGEVVLGCSEWLLACSTSAGPAFEGGEVSCGMPAVMGVIERIDVDEDLNVVYSTVGNEKPAGVCGSGLISLLAGLFRRDVIDHQGRFSDMPSDRLRSGANGLEFVVVFGDETVNGRDISLNEKDVRNILLGKAAIYAGARTLSRVGVDFNDLQKIYIAGGFGYHIDLEKAITIGLLPDIPRERFEFIGNGSLRGAYMALVDDEVKKGAESLAKKVTYFNLSESKDFNEEYLNALYLPHKDGTLFPSVGK